MAAPGQCETHTGSSCLKQLQLLPWQTTSPFLLRNRASSDALPFSDDLPNLHVEEAERRGAQPQPRRGSGTRDGTGRRQVPELTAQILWADFSPFCLQKWRSKYLYSLQQQLSRDKRVGVSAFLPHNKPTGVVGRVNWCKQQLYSLSYLT